MGMLENLSIRREFLKRLLRTVMFGAVAGVCGILGIRKGRAGQEMVWQLDPDICNQCGKCATDCVLPQSAVKCVNSFSMCGYCDLCSGYLKPGAKSRDTGAENRLCPTGALTRKFIEDPYFQYTIDQELCIGCGKCVKECGAFGNGSLYLQIRHDRCLNCNECSIARVCPSRAFRRAPSGMPYLLRGDEGNKSS